MPHEKVSRYLRQGNLYPKWILGCIESEEVFEVSEDESALVNVKMKTYLQNIWSHDYKFSLFVTEKQYEDETITYFKSVSSEYNKKPPFDIFMMVDTRFFTEGNITFLDAKILVKPSKGFFNDLVAKQVALDLGKSIANYELFIAEQSFYDKSVINNETISLSKQFIKVLKTIPQKQPEVQNKLPNGSRTNFEYEPKSSIKQNRELVQHSEFVIEENVEVDSLKESVDARFSSEERSVQEVTTIVKENGVSSSAPNNGHSNGHYNIEEEKIVTTKPEAIEQDNEDWRDLCYQDGIWHKWIIERCNEDEKKVYFRVKEQLEQQDIHFNENKILRFLGARQFDEEDGLNALIENHKFYEENDCKVFKLEDFEQKIKDQMVVQHNFDKYGRPVVYFRVRYNNPSSSTTRQVMLYLLWSLHKIKEATPKHIDNYLLIYDMKDAGLSNFSISQMNGTIRSLGSQFPETIYKIFVVNYGWVINTIWGAMKNLVYPKTIEKVIFAKNNQLPDALLPFIPIENIPVEFGGEDEEYSKKFRT